MFASASNDIATRMAPTVHVPRVASRDDVEKMTDMHVPNPDTSFPALLPAKLSRMADAAVEAVECIRALHQGGSNPVAEVLRGHGDFTELEHYPPDDVYDPHSHAQYYFHAHPPEDRDAPDFGHFHTFLRPKGMPVGIRPARTDDVALPAGGNDALSHLVAISMSSTGMPERLFTTNRWVTAETWYAAPDIIAMLDRFSLDLSFPSAHLNRWLTAMLVLFRPQIEGLLIERDRAVERWRARNPGSDVFEDRRLEITSSIEISLHDHIAWLDSQIEASLQVRRCSRATGTECLSKLSVPAGRTKSP